MRINDTFLEQIDGLRNDGKDMFYNSNGNKDAYKAFVRHISYATNLGYGKIQNGNLCVGKNMLLIDFELEKIIEIKSGEVIKILELIQLK